MSEAHAASDRLEAFASMVETSPHNLVSRRARGELRTRHVPECVELAELLPQGPHRVLDLGSGGGFPGVVLKIVRPELDVHLLDSTQKKVAFLEHVADRLSLSLSVHRGRAETLARPPLSGSFDIVTARAVAALDQLVRWGIPFLRPGGLLYAVKGERWAQEIAAAEEAMRRVGARVVATPDENVVPRSTAPRVVVVSRDR